MTFDSDELPPQATVLVVDDYRDIVNILTLLLTSHGMNVLQAYSGAECLELVRTHPVDLVLLDVMMPDMDGLAVCAALKRISPALPIILMTADMTIREAARHLDVSGYIVKPFKPADLLARIRTHLHWYTEN